MALDESDPAVVLSVREVKKYFHVGHGKLGRRTVRAADGISLDIRRGEVLALVGESGSGKSTVARTVARLYRPDSGDIIVGDLNVARLEGRALRSVRHLVQMTFQDPYSSLNPRMRVGDSIAEPLIELTSLRSDAKARRRRVDELLELVQLPSSFYRRYPTALSGGQRQRVGIARALAVKPRLVVLDEPLSALDVSVQASLINLLNEIQAQTDAGYLFIAHDLAVVRYFSDRVAVMHLGKIVEQGTADEIFDHPTDEYTKALLASAPAEDPSRRKHRERYRAASD